MGHFTKVPSLTTSYEMVLLLLHYIFVIFPDQCSMFTVCKMNISMRIVFIWDLSSKSKIDVFLNIFEWKQGMVASEFWGKVYDLRTWLLHLFPFIFYVLWAIRKCTLDAIEMAEDLEELYLLWTVL